MRARYGEIVAVTDDFCHRYLNQEYAALAQRMTASLCRKRPSPLTAGQALTWACGILYSLGQMNFLWDRATEPHMTTSEMCATFAVGQSTASAKAAEIRRVLNLHPFDPNWSLQSLLDKNPLVWMLQINGVILDIREAPRHVQEIALGQGLIPYLPDNKAS